jgi:hypothetical protein
MTSSFLKPNTLYKKRDVSSDLSRSTDPKKADNPFVVF